MNTNQLLISGWTFNPAVLVAGIGALAVYCGSSSARRRVLWLVAAVATAF